MDKIIQTFGRRSIWLAIREIDKQEICATLGLEQAQEVNWSTGMDYTKENNGYIMVTEPYEHWNFVVGLSLPELSYHKFTLNWIKEISKVLGDVCYFESYRTVGLAGFATAKNGILKRAYCYVGDQGTVVYNYGEISEAEKILGFNFAPDDKHLFEDGFTDCDEDEILMLAEEWTVNPDNLEGKLACEVVCGKVDLNQQQQQFKDFII